ncbi:type III secretion system chaperone [Prosthecomicrobium sp. N25]|uniref:type III secretion system chaperone n=1 Tax=Prosthecomicrobium sp. N25 TaxID=3129254 RepID=UPI003077BC3C
MADVETLTRVLAEAGARDDAIAGVLRTAANAWLVRFEDVDVEIEYDSAGDRLVFASVIGPVPQQKREEILEALLAYSFLARETGGVHMAMTAPGGEAVQMAAVPGEGAGVDRLVTVVTNMAENTRIWRAMFASAMGLGAAEPVDVPGMMIRI